MILVTCPREIPPYLAKEVEALGYKVAALHPAAVELNGTLEDCMRLNLWLRTAHRVLYKLGGWKCRTIEDMYKCVQKIAWEEVIESDGYVSVISSVKTSAIDNDMFANMKCKDAIVDRIRDKKGERPDSGSRNDRTVIFLYWHDDELIVYLDTSGNVLSNRGYRMHPAKAPLRETLAAAVIMATKWDPEFPFINPMGGSGTLAIEAALISRNIAPGLLRHSFGFQYCMDYNEEAWEKMRADARSQMKPKCAAQIVCTDDDFRSIRMAKDNAKKAGVLDDITWKACDFTLTPLPVVNEKPDNIFDVDAKLPAVVMNPEYGLRLGDVTDLQATYGEIGDFFKQSCSGYAAYVFTGNFELAKHIGLRSKRRVPFYTADIESRLIEFLMYRGGKKVGINVDEPVAG